MVDSFPETGFDRMTVREFAPGVRHPNRLRRMYHQATYAGLRIVVNAMLAGILHEMIVLCRKDTNQTEISHLRTRTTLSRASSTCFLLPAPTAGAGPTHLCSYWTIRAGSWIQPRVCT